MIGTEILQDLSIGGRGHQEKINQILKELNGKGLEAVRDFCIILSRKTNKSRLVDVAGLDRNKRLVELHLVSRLNRFGGMLKHEAETIQDIEEETGVKVQFHSFNYYDQLTMNI